MKTIISITEVILYNLFPAALAAPVIIIIKNIVPLAGVAVIRLGLYIMLGLQKLQHGFFQKMEHDEEENLHRSLRF